MIFDIIERSNWSDQSGKVPLKRDFFNLPGPEWCWETDWQVVKGPNTDHEGWEYAKDFKKRAFGPIESRLHHIRRRQWVRTCSRTTDKPEADFLTPIVTTPKKLNIVNETGSDTPVL